MRLPRVLTAWRWTTAGRAPTLRLEGFLSDRTSATEVVEFRTEPSLIYAEEGRENTHLNFDFAIEGLTDRVLDLVFLKVAAYDATDTLVTYRYLNRNAVGPAGIHTLGPTQIEGREVLDLFNPFHTFPLEPRLTLLRYMFTFRDPGTGEEFYYGDVVVRPVTYRQRVLLRLPVRGLVTVLDGHDYFSHHRRFAMSVARAATGGSMRSNFARYALDFVHIGDDGNTRRMPGEERSANYDFRFPDARRFYSDGAPIYAPADGEVAIAVDGHPDLYQGTFDLEAAVQADRVHDLAGNYVVIRHNDDEYSHLFHFRKGSLQVEVGQRVASGQRLGDIGFSGAATVYSHLHYQLMDGPDFLVAAALPVRFHRIMLFSGKRQRHFRDSAVDTGDILWSE